MMKESPELLTARSEDTRIVFTVFMHAYFPEMYRTACGMLRRGRFTPTILFTGDDDFTHEFSLCRDVGLGYVVDPGSKSSGHFGRNTSKLDSVGEMADPGAFVSDASSGIKQRLKRLPVLGPLLQKVHNLYVRYIVTKTAFICLPWHLHRLRGLRRRAKVVLQMAQPHVVVLPHVDLGGILGSIAIEARQRGIPVVVIPYTWIFRDEIMKVLIGKPEYQTSGLINRWVSRRYPQWLFRDCLFLPAVNIVAMEWLQFPTANPWMDDNIADVIAVDSEVMLRSYVADGVPAHKCWVTGSASHDILAHSRLTKMDNIFPEAENASQHNGDGQFALSFLPPDQTHNQMAGFEFLSYWEMLLFWIETAMVNDAIPTIFSVHPRMKGRVKGLKSSWLARFPKLTIHEGDACELIPHARFCVGQFSGMMRYAIACAKPVLYYDVFNYRIHGNEFTSASSVITVNGRAAFAEAYARFVTDKAYLSVLESKARINANEWGQLDGRASERIEALIAAQCLAPKPFEKYARSCANLGACH